MNKFTKKAKKYGPWSSSKLDVAKNCALRFYWKYLEKRREAKIADSRGRIGIAAHQALELVSKGQDISRALRKAAIDSRLTITEADDLLFYRPNITRFAERLIKYKKSNPVKNEFIEQKFGLDKDFKSIDFWDNEGIFRGVFDHGLELEAKAAIIIDHKTGERKPISNFQSQLDTYSIAAVKTHPDIDGVQTAVHFVKTGDIDWNPYVDKGTINKQLVPWLTDKINSGAENVTADDPQPCKGWYCTFCGYKTNCPEWTNK